MTIKSKELAKLLGVSTATVSLVINNRPGISASLREKLISDITELGYRDMIKGSVSQDSKKEETRNFAGKKNIALAIYTTHKMQRDSFSFFPAVIEGIENEAHERGYDVKILHMNGYERPLKSCINSKDTVGVVVQASNITDKILKELSELDVPYVSIDNFHPGKNVSSVCVNNEMGIYSAVSHLVNLGHKKIGYISSGSDRNALTERRRCFHLELRNFGLSDRAEDKFICGTDETKAVTTLMEMFKNCSELPTAFVAESDVVAWHCIRALKRLNYHIPNDVSVVGFDDLSIASLMEPPLTTVRSHRHLLGREIVIQLVNQENLNKIGYENVPIKLCVGITFMVRESTGPVKDY